MAKGFKKYSKEYDAQACPSIDVAADFFDYQGYDCIGRTVKGQKLSTHRHRILGETLLVASEMRFYSWDRLWNGEFPFIHLPVRKDGTWYDKWVSVSPDRRELFMLDAADVRNSRKMARVTTYCSEREPMICVSGQKAMRYRREAGAWKAYGPMLA